MITRKLSEAYSRMQQRFKPLHLLDNLTIPQKMLLILIGSVILPLALVNAYYYAETEKNVQQGMLNRLTLSLDEKTRAVNGSLSGAVTLANRYNTNEQLYRFLDEDYRQDLDYLMVYQDQIKAMMQPDLSYNEQVRRLTLYTDNPTLFNGALVTRMTTDNIETLGEEVQDLRVHALSADSGRVLLRVSQETPLIRTSNDRSLSLVRPLTFYPQYSKYRKVLRVDIELTHIASMLRNRDQFDNILLIDPDGRILVSSHSYSEFGPFERFSENSLPAGVVAIRQSLDDVPLALVGTYDTNIIAKEFRRSRGRVMLIASAGMLLAVLLTLLVSGNITRRTRQVVSQARQIAQGNFIQIGKEGMGRDEIGVLSEGMNRMSVELERLIDVEYNARLRAAQLERESVQARLSALQSQVNPHFLFNALESIRIKSAVRGEEETARMIKYMSRMFRQLIVWEDDIIPLKEDLRFLDEFLKIQKYRFDDEFEHVLTVDEAAMDCMLPKLLIQPLVENACVHGVEAVSRNRWVGIEAKVEGESLRITVSDNGGGMGEERLARLRRMLAGGEKLPGSVGIRNVFERLTLYYGHAFGFEVDSRLGEGTTIALAIPVQHDRETLASRQHPILRNGSESAGAKQEGGIA